MPDTPFQKTPAQLLQEAAQRALQVRRAAQEAAQQSYGALPTPPPQEVKPSTS